MTVTILQGDALDVLRTLDDESVQCVVTSPPYWGLRDYGVDGQLGLEPTPEEYVARLVAVFAEVKRVLRDDGVLWLNLGDSYAGSNCGSNDYRETTGLGAKPTDRYKGQRPGTPAGLKPKDLVGIPWRVAFALQADGWWLRSDIIWHKPNPMPESVTDRCTKAHEYVFMLTKSARYYWDQEAIAEPSVHAGETRTTTPKGFAGQAIGAGVHPTGNAIPGSIVEIAPTRNRRDVWSIATQPYSGAHYAVMPPALAEVCIKAGTSERGGCPVCGAPWERVVERTAGTSHQRRGYTAACGSRNDGDRPGSYSGPEIRELGWRPPCDHDVEPVPCVVLDPFGGAGTTGLVADRLGRDAVLIELNADNCDMAERRIKDDAGMWAEVVSE